MKISYSLSGNFEEKNGQWGNFRSLFSPFLLALLMTIGGKALFPSISFDFFVPFLAMVYCTVSFEKAVGIAIGSALLLDLISSEFRFGFYGLNFFLITLIVHKRRRFFFFDKKSSLVLLTMLIAALSSFFQLFLFYLFDSSISFPVREILKGSLLVAFLDGIYGWIWFLVPMALYAHLKRVGWRGVLLRDSYGR